LVIGFVVALVCLMRLGRRHPIGLIAVGTAIAIAVLIAIVFSKGNDEEGFDAVSGFLWPGAKILELMPYWVYTLIWAALAASLVAFAWTHSG
jgi:hypothetical protein